MESVVEVFGAHSLGVVLTGMGTDGAKGITAIYRCGGFTIGQDEASCAVYGMPRVCAQRGVLSRVAPLDDIVSEILRLNTAASSPDPHFTFRQNLCLSNNRLTLSSSPSLVKGLARHSSPISSRFTSWSPYPVTSKTLRLAFILNSRTARLHPFSPGKITSVNSKSISVMFW